LTIVSTTISFPSPPPSLLEGERGRVRGVQKFYLKKEGRKGRKRKKI